jgi:glycerol-3-phosphate acyltransferase PlsY
MLISALLLGYFLGSIPAGYVITRLKGIDIRKEGSGNIGFTNVFRVMGQGNSGKWLSALVLAWDMGKGYLAVWIAPHISPDPMAPIGAGFAAFLGHLFPVWLGFRGGKGVATGLGVSLGISWVVGTAVTAIWAVVFAVTRISSLAALTAFFFLPLLAAFWARKSPLPHPDLLYLAVMSVLIWFRHHENLQRLIRGEERPIR